MRFWQDREGEAKGGIGFPWISLGGGAEPRKNGIEFHPGAEQKEIALEGRKPEGRFDIPNSRIYRRGISRLRLLRSLVSLQGPAHSRQRRD